MLRNGEVHGTMLATRAQAQRQEIARQLTESYASRKFMEPEGLALLGTDQEAHLQQPTQSTKNWLAVAGPVICNIVRRIKKVFLQGARSLRSYFPRTGYG